MKSARKPVRECVSCGKKDSKQNMLRVACTGETVSLDPLGKAPGRGAYVCKNRECIENAILKKRFNRSFRKNIGSEIYESLSGFAENETI